MTIRKQTLLMLVFMALLAVIINSLLFGALIDRTFVGVLEERYQNQVERIIGYMEEVATADGVTAGQVQRDLQAFLEDPVTGVALYGTDGELVLSVENRGMGMMHGPAMHDRMMRRRIPEEQDEYDLVVDDQTVGRLVVSRRGTVGDTATALLFQDELLRNSLLAGALVLLIALGTGYLVSRRTSRDLVDTAAYARTLDREDGPRVGRSGILEIRQIQQALEDLAARSRLRERSRKQTVDMITHQARTPLTVLKSNIEGMKDGVLETDADRLDGCNRQVDALARLVDHLGEVVETSTPEPVLTVEPFDLSEELHAIGRGFRGTFDSKGVRFVMEIPEGLQALGDRHLLAGSLYSALSNAYKFTPAGGQVTLSAGTLQQEDRGFGTIGDPGSGVRITVSDTGIGIPREELDAVFRPYVRGRNAGEVPGQGLGLYILKTNIDRMGGQVDIESQEGRGTTVRIALKEETETTPDARTGCQGRTE